MKINLNKFFSIIYTTQDGRTETYLCRAGVRKWKTKNGTCEVKGTGHETPEGMIRLYAANRMNYRTFDLSRIKRVKQGNNVFNSLNL